MSFMLFHKILLRKQVLVMQLSYLFFHTQTTLTTLLS